MTTISPNPRPRRALRGVAALSLLMASGATALVTSSSAALAVSAGTPQLFERETVQVELNSSGGLDVARLFTQLTAVGNGTVKVSDPTSTKGLRNLDGFSLPHKTPDGVEWSFSVDGQANRRTVADFTKPLPVTVNVNYTLNGQSVSPSQVVGKSGELGVTYTVQNVTSTPTIVTFKDGLGRIRTETLDIVTPFVGQLSTVLPSSFHQIVAPRADIAGDGRGGNQLVWTMVLFSPIGETVQTFGYTAQIHKASLPPATVQIVPVPPKRKPELAFGEAGFNDGVASGQQLTDGAGQIDANVLKLRDGASQLLDGLTQLAAGATTLSSGLNGQAIPGAKQLAAGLDTAKAGASNTTTGLPALASGAGKVADGALQVKDGSAALAAGAGQVDAGALQLKDGLALIAGGLDQLAAVSTGLPAAKAGAMALRFGISHPPLTLGPTDPGGLLEGLSAVLLGLSHPVGAGGASDPGGVLEGLSSVLLGLSHPVGAGGASDPGGVLEGLGSLKDPATGLPAAKGGVDQVNFGLDHAVGALGASDPGGAKQALTAMQAGAQGLLGSLNPFITAFCSPPVSTECQLLVGSQSFASAVNAGIGNAATPNTLLNGVALATGGLTQVSGGLGNAITGVGALYTGVSQLAGGVGALHTGVGQLTAGVGALKTGVQTQVVPGLDQLVSGLTTAVAGVVSLQTGAHTALAGATDLSGGTGDLAAGANDLSAGASTLSSGADQVSAGASKANTDLNDGLNSLAAGAHQLSTGLAPAGSGASQIAGGLAEASSGGKQIRDGAGQLHSEGTSKLVASGNDTTIAYGRSAAIMAVLDERGKDGALPYGAPAGATGSAAYLYTLAAETHQTVEGTTRGLVALALLALGSVSGVLLRRRAVTS